MPITALYAGLLAPILLFLITRVIGQRRNQKVEIGDGNDRELLRRMRVHANFIETAPFALILMGLAESIRAPSLALHVLGALLLIGRALHAYGLSQTPHIMRLRVAGMVMTMLSVAGGALLCLGLYAGLFVMRP
jgi:uncharacterized protein